MSLTLNQQISELIKNSHHILLTTNENDTGDGIASILALKLFLQKINKPADIVVSEKLKNKFSFLFGSENIKTINEPLKKLIITLDVEKNPVKDFNYNLKNNQLKIYITPLSGEIKKESITIEPSNYKYDLIITAGCQDLESLGRLYSKEPEFFFQTTIINIDNHPANERFGQINHISLNTSSCSELLFNLLNSTQPENINSEIATNLLSGIILKTENFRTPAITPECLHNASYLMKLGADQSYIINNLNKNKSITTLNLWGRILARLKQDTHYNLAWSLVSQTDFQKSGGSIEDLEGVVNELLSRSPHIKITVLLFETNTGNINGEIYTSPNYNALDLASPWQGTGTKNRACFQLKETRLILAEQAVINQLREFIRPIH
ncbi:hypothetical protein GYA54_04320 [Candidatus Kuenenbacteria bacterium]|nr:hypothetical protein [Candidatus Kuenenbacteria bacterium]